MEEDFTEESSDGTLVRGDDQSYDAHKFPVQRGHSNTLDTADTLDTLDTLDAFDIELNLFGMRAVLCLLPATCALYHDV